MAIKHFEFINKIISDLYDNEISIRNRVVNFYMSLMEEVYFNKGTILFYFKNHDNYYQKHSSIPINCNEEVVKFYSEYYCRLDDTLPVLDQPAPIIIRASTFFDKALREETIYYKEYLYPNNSIYSVDANLSIKSNIGLKGLYCFYRGVEQNDFTDDEVEILKLFQPHLSNIFKHYGEDDDFVSQLFMFDASINSVGVCILDNNLQIVRCNNVFKKIIAQKEIMEKIHFLCKGLKQNKNNPFTVSCEYKLDNAPYYLEITGIYQKDNINDCQFTCLVYDLSRIFFNTLNQAKEKYQLSQTELSIIKSILKGYSSEDIARELNFSLSTVKKYLTTIYERMEIKNQKQIYDKLKLLS